ncbi:hypothetical protein G7081_05570 [Vagococcus coleopterorum]|uniref:Uncharacterized protein n=1 Tax=Vagococcus coleopterorum TaxID=2714946 RepID=A0A6G8ANC4_9ENTE|nr:hypothetical protein [Vagococcus coleopterorum]QIL46581.1 hypothetical protein G7081_05570 [Vagococcus coleopterorum]
MILKVEEDYHDRGMIKWQGFILTEHKEELEQGKGFVEEVELVDVEWE